ncbi:hypothetical protein DM464_03645 [Salmonella enterica subsp. enterica]|nr:hypothetical protein DM464_03645 [Salmonella enterica subsp. enterica]
MGWLRITRPTHGPRPDELELFWVITSVDYLKIALFGVTVLYLVIVTSLCCCQCKIMHCQLKRNLTPCK